MEEFPREGMIDAEERSCSLVMRGNGGEKRTRAGVGFKQWYPEFICSSNRREVGMLLGNYT